MTARDAPRRRIVVIEGDEDSADTLCELLCDLGHLVDAALDGPSGLLMVRANRPELVFCDLRVPALTGVQLAVAVRGDVAVSETLLIAVGDGEREADQRASFAAGFDAFLPKPLTIDAVEAAIAAADASCAGQWRSCARLQFLRG